MDVINVAIVGDASYLNYMADNNQLFIDQVVQVDIGKWQQLDGNDFDLVIIDICCVKARILAKLISQIRSHTRRKVVCFLSTDIVEPANAYLVGADASLFKVDLSDKTELVYSQLKNSVSAIQNLAGKL